MNSVILTRLPDRPISRMSLLLTIQILESKSDLKYGFIVFEYAVIFVSSAGLKISEPNALHK